MVEESTPESSGELTQEEIDARIDSLIGTAPIPEERHNVHNFLHNVAIAEDTTKLGYLSEEEVGTPNLPLRTYKELALFSGVVLNKSYYKEYFEKKGEILTSTSLSKDAKLLNLAITTNRQVTTTAPEQPKKENKGWFKPRRKKFM